MTDKDQHLRDLTARFSRVRHAVLEPDVLHGILPFRARTLPARAASPEARAREDRFAASSPTYAAALRDSGDLDGRARVIDLLGLRWWVPLLRPDDDAAVERAIGHQDFPFRVIAQTREVGIGGLMLDLGANVGRMSIPRVILGDVQAAYCAEPDPLNYACLTRNARDNHLRGLVLPDQVAIGSVNGTVTLERGSSSGGHRIVNAIRRARRERVEVPALTLDSWVDRLGVDLDLVTFVKVDTQGSEVHILHGAHRVLSARHIAWQFEVDPKLLDVGGSSVAELFALLRRHFTHFVDLSRHAVGARARPVADLEDGLAYVCADPEGRTDVLVFTLAPIG